jgi:Na+/proline symporter
LVTPIQHLEKEKNIREKVTRIAADIEGVKEPEDSDYVFITFVLNYLPTGLIGLLLAVIFSAAMSTTASELNALATTSTIDYYKRVLRPGKNDHHYLRASKLFTILWGGIALFFASIASQFDNLIEAVNIVGSLFYGTILGRFLCGFFIKRLRAQPVFLAAIIGEMLVIALFLLNRYEVIRVEYLWLNLIGCLAVILLAFVLQWGNRQDTGALDEEALSR